MFSLRELSTTYPEQLWLKLSGTLQEQVWQRAQHHSHATSRCNAYLNDLCLNTFVPWLEGWFEEELPAENTNTQPPISLSIFQQSSLPSIWEFVNGSLIKLDKIRLAIIPNETTDLEEFCVPQEWVDLPNWRADYYLAVQVNLDNLDESCIRLWGYVSHQKLKKKGIYEESDRSYYIRQRYLDQDLTMMLLAPEPVLEAQVESVPSLSKPAANKLLEKLGDSSVYFPRLAVGFQQWGALLANEQWRQELYERRLGQFVAAATPGETAVNLRQWPQQVVDVVEEGWQTVEALLTPLEPSPVRGRGSSPKTVSLEAIVPVISLLQTDQSEVTRCQAAGVLGNIGAGHPEAIDALTELLHTAQDEETRWQAALSLGKIAPSHPQAGVRKARLIDLGMQLGSHKVVLIVAIMPKVNEKIGVWLQVQPVDKHSKLPPHLKLAVLSESGEKRLETEARSNEQGRGKDKSIERRFSPPPGTNFRVKVALDELSITQDFVA
ncbi:MAG: DUF1822 family protein [Symploca sp. SIO1A3]|nr:DUF1822 family protein [Symploca sp. SIO1A3]